MRRVRDYFIRRILLLIPTLLVITIIVFGVTRIAPGGPLEQAMLEMRQASQDGGGGDTAATGKAISKKDLDQMKELYGYDKPAWKAYLIWLGVMSRERHKEEFEFVDGAKELTGKKRIPTFPVMELDWDGDGFVTPAEVPGYMAREVNFPALDTNHDGYIDEAEGTRPGSRVRRVREVVRLQRDDAGNVSIENADEVTVDWRVRMVHPVAGLANELEDAEGKMELAVAKSQLLESLQAKLIKLREGAEAETKLSWSEGAARVPQLADEIVEFVKEDFAATRQELVDANASAAALGQLDQVRIALGNAAEAGRASPTAEVYLREYSGVLQGDLGTSFKSNEDVWKKIKSCLPVSTFFGLTTFLVTYLVCIPLGIAKAMKHNGWFDNLSSVGIFMGYSIPGYVLGALLFVFLAARAGLFPSGGFVSENFHGMPLADLRVDAETERWRAPAHGLQPGDVVWFKSDVPPAEPALLTEASYHVKPIDADHFTLHADPVCEDAPINVLRSGEVSLRRPTSFWEKFKDLAHHVFLPLCCYLVTSFAFVTMLMKNHLMDNLSADYMRTAVAKGVPFSQAVRRHALRNSLIPLATNLGHQVILFVAGSFLIETIFSINGFGDMGFTAITNRDIPVVMGVLMLSATLILLGNIISDVLVALVDPRVRFE